MTEFDKIRNDGYLLYEYLRGSHCHGIATEKSDYDYGGIFITPMANIIDLGFNYKDQIANESNDIVWYELKKFMTLLLKSNPTVLEALFVDDKYVLYNCQAMRELKEYRNEFLTKKCFNSFFSYAKSQIEKAKGLNKMINWERDKIERKGILDFTYTVYNQGSTKIKNWLEYRGLDQKYCGLVNIPNMKDIYGVYYDWGKFFEESNITLNDLIEGWYNIKGLETSELVAAIKAETNEDKKKHYEELLQKSYISNMAFFIVNFYNLEETIWDSEQQGLSHVIDEKLSEWYNSQKPIGYCGMVGENSQQLRLCSVSKGERPICYVSYNKDGYTKHCVDYRNYKDWEKHRNPVRYESNLHKSYDAKNMCECFRLMQCGIEVANGEGYIVDRSERDAQFLLDIKNHKFEYEELIERLEKLKGDMEIAMANSKLKEDIDSQLVNDLYVNIRKNFP